jgi:hypothetical protein
MMSHTPVVTNMRRLAMTCGVGPVPAISRQGSSETTKGPPKPATTFLPLRHIATCLSLPSTRRKFDGFSSSE